MDTNIYNDLPHIDQRTIECDMRRFTKWLNDMADIVNWLKNEFPIMQDRMDDLERRVKCLEERMDDAERRIGDVEECCDDAHSKIKNIQNDINNINMALDMFQDRLQWFYDHLPTVYGNVPLDWKFAMGNINVMSDNDGTPSIQGAGIFTSMAIEDNDIYFN